MRNNQELTTNVSQVFTTTDYSMFKSIGGNRSLNQLHAKRLKQSMANNYLFTVIIVNEKYEIIDGQHRFECIKELELPLHYVICHGYSLNEVHLLNQNSKVWISNDYLEGYCQLGYRDYIVFRDFKNKYNLGITESIALLKGSLYSSSDINVFYNGKFKVTHLFEAEDFMDRLSMLKPYYAGYKRRSFIFALMQLVKKPQFEFLEFLQKIKIQPSALQDCINITQYILLIEDIYNYKRRDKVNLRF